jgi:predicted nucleic acid-binding protein
MPDLRFVLDAWALVALLQGEEPAASDVRDLLQQAQSNDTIQLFVSVVNLGEVYYIISRARR